MTENKNPFFAKDNKHLGQLALEEKFLLHINLISNRPFCQNFDRVDYDTKCTCMHQLRDEETNLDRRDDLLRLLLQFNEQNEESRQIILHGIITNGFIRKDGMKRGEKSLPMFALPGVEASDVGADNMIENKYLVCVNALRWIFFVGRKKWYKLEKQAALPRHNVEKKRRMK